MPRLSRADENVVSEFGFEFSTPPAIAITRSSKYEAMWEAAKELVQKFPGQTLKVIEYDKKGTAYQTARAINNGENKAFKHDYESFVAKAARVNEEDENTYAIWLTFKPEVDEE
jgi:hypothetical protein